MRTMAVCEAACVNSFPLTASSRQITHLVDPVPRRCSVKERLTLARQRFLHLDSVRLAQLLPLRLAESIAQLNLAQLLLASAHLVIRLAQHAAWSLRRRFLGRSLWRSDLEAQRSVNTSAGQEDTGSTLSLCMRNLCRRSLFCGTLSCRLCVFDLCQFCTTIRLVCLLFALACRCAIMLPSRSIDVEHLALALCLVVPALHARDEGRRSLHALLGVELLLLVLVLPVLEAPTLGSNVASLSLKDPVYAQ